MIDKRKQLLILGDQLTTLSKMLYGNCNPVDKADDLSQRVNISRDLVLAALLESGERCA